MTFRRFLFRLCAFALLTCVFDGGSVSAEPDHPVPINQSPMRVVIVRGAEPDCKPKCREWISAEGALRPETANAFQRILSRPGTQKLPILISSGGGSVEAALAIGRMIRSRQLSVAVSKTNFKPCDGADKDCRPNDPRAVLQGEPDSRSAFCASACTFILAAGIHRFVAPWAKVGIHQVTSFQKETSRTVLVKTTIFETPEHEIVSRKSIIGGNDSSRVIKLDAPPPETVAKIHAYLKQMGISEQLQALMAATPPKDIHWMTRDELHNTFMATEYYGGEYLAAQEDDSGASGHESQTDKSKAEMASLAYGTLNMPNFTDHELTVLLEFLHRKGDPNVEIVASVEPRPGFAPAGNLALTLQFGVRKQAPLVSAVSAHPTTPMLASFPASYMCSPAPNDIYTQLTLAQQTPGARISGPSVLLNLRRLVTMPELLADICKV